MPLTDMRLKAVFGFGQAAGTIRSVNTFSFIALLVLLIACVNFMNLATARSANRAREVGLRKVVGAFRKSIVGQFYGESLLTAALAAVAALGCAALLLPAFNALSGKQIALAALVSWKFGLGLAGILILTALVSGSYPAIYLSAFQPIRVLQGRPSGSSKSLAFRKTLVLIQFSLSILLLIGTGVVYRQIEFMRTKNPGYDKDHIVYLAMRGEAVKSYAALKAELLRDPRIHGVSAIDQKPTNVGNNSWGASWEGKDPDQRVLISHAFVDFDFPETMGIEMAAGRTFSTAFAADEGHAYLVNEEVAKLMGLEPAAAVGRPFRVSLADPRAWNLKEHLLSVSLEGGLPANIEAFKAEILRHPGI